MLLMGVADECNIDVDAVVNSYPAVAACNIDVVMDKIQRLL